jgi:hypothetical protein
MIVAASLVLALVSAPGARQDPAPVPPPAAARSPQSDLTLVNLPTTLSMQRHRSYFRLTHRFARDLRRGDFSELAADLFSLDNGAVIGLEYRFAITGRLHAGAHRSLLSKTIQTFAKWDALRQEDGRPLSLSVLASVEGLNNLRRNRQPAIAATLSRTFGEGLALYATPAFVSGTRAVDFADGDDDTAFVGLGARVRVRPRVYVVAEVSPRVSGYDPGRATWAAAIERRTRGHSLQLSLTNSFGTTPGQIARGGSDHDIYLGFNITRRF